MRFQKLIASGLVALLVLSGLLVVLGFVPEESKAAGPTFSSEYTSSSPTIDGELSDGEWSGASTNFVTVNGAKESGMISDTIDIEIFVMNDDENLYFGVKFIGE